MIGRLARSLAASTWPETQGTTLVLVPVGSIEQHGPHLPMDTDSVIAQAVTRRVAALLPDEPLVAPVLSYGASGEHQHFSGTSSIGTDALRQMLVELARSMATWAQRLVFVNAHGGNVFALCGAVSQLRAEGRDAAWVACATEQVDAHAGYTETSLMLHLRPDNVRLDLAVAGNIRPIGDLLPALVEGGVIAVSANGVLGDPAGASDAEGRRVLEEMSAEIAGLLVSGTPDKHGRLAATAGAGVLP